MRIIKKGIDVSAYQKEIDWEKVKPHIDFAILRCGYGLNEDEYFQRNAKECTRLNIPFGIYLYGEAFSKEEAINEAKFTLKLAKDYKIKYPIFYDVFEGRTNLTKDELTSIVESYCDTIEKDRYYVGIYADAYRFNTILSSYRLEKYDKWVAQWNRDFTYKGTAGMWQDTDYEELPGIKGRVDGDIAFKDYPKIIKDANLNHLEDDELKIGDEVEIKKAGNKNPEGTDEAICAIGLKRKILNILKDKPYPYEIGNDYEILGYYQKDALKKI